MSAEGPAEASDAIKRVIAALTYDYIEHIGAAGDTVASGEQIPLLHRSIGQELDMIERQLGLKAKGRTILGATARAIDEALLAAAEAQQALSATPMRPKGPTMTDEAPMTQDKPETPEPCPFCNGPAHTWQRGRERTWAAGCAVGPAGERPLSCTVRPFAYAPTKAEAIAAWNTRPAPRAGDALAEELETAVAAFSKNGSLPGRGYNPLFARILAALRQPPADALDVERIRPAPRLLGYIRDAASYRSRDRLADLRMALDQIHDWADEAMRETARTLTPASAVERENGWQPIETAPVNEAVHWWIEGLGESGWIKTGERQNSAEPLCIVSDEGYCYWPHENGGYPTHWQPLPEPPALADAGREG